MALFHLPWSFPQRHQCKATHRRCRSLTFCLILRLTFRNKRLVQMSHLTNLLWSDSFPTAAKAGRDLAQRQRLEEVPSKPQHDGTRRLQCKRVKPTCRLSSRQWSDTFPVVAKAAPQVSEHQSLQTESTCKRHRQIRRSVPRRCRCDRPQAHQQGNGRQARKCPSGSFLSRRSALALLPNPGPRQPELRAGKCAKTGVREFLMRLPATI
mmetsp:Transcript_6514/g.21076  ORF Transcript_6514/g.21076 Transcript_6514/m.21076 type:complete len:209 (+) Transcript_6514:66-692(+)